MPLFWPPYSESQVVSSKEFRPGNRAGVFKWENFHPGYRDLISGNGDLGNRAWSPPHEYIETFTKEVRVMRDLDNRAIPPSPSGSYGEAFNSLL